MLCNLCPRQCNAIRTQNENIGGVCRSPEEPRVARAALHFWEEPSISGTNGSGTVFFSGCSLHCVFCQNSDISIKNKGKAVSVNELAYIFKTLENEGAHNINLVTPTHYVHSIIDALDIYKPKIPIVYNSGGYESAETLKKLRGYIDIYLMDFKYIDDNKARLYSHAVDYPQVCKSALLEAYSQQNECVFKDSIMQSGLIVRHLLMPGYLQESKAIIRYVYEEYGERVVLSIMNQYTPLKQVEKYPEINRKVSDAEYESLINYAISIVVKEAYVQEGDTAEESFIPPFDLEGV